MYYLFNFSLQIFFGFQSNYDTNIIVSYINILIFYDDWLIVFAWMIIIIM